MPLLGGLFSRKHKSSPRLKRDDNASTSVRSNSEELESTLSSPTASSYGTPERSVPSYPNGRSLLHPDSAIHVHAHSGYASPMPSVSTPSSAGSSKLRLFGRKKSSVSGSDSNTTTSPDLSSDGYSAARQPLYQSHPMPNVFSDTDPPDLRRLRPPPSRSAIFAAYGDPNSALSTRSLPTETSRTIANASPPPPLPQPQKRPSLFPWTKSSSSAASLPPTSPPKDSVFSSESLPHVIDPPTNADNGSFNLKSFRHIRAPSPTRSTNGNGSNVALSAPIPRPRGASINSDASQRISVAAFREAQARRSMAGSPSPSFRTPSPAPAVPTGSMTPEERVGRNGPRPSRSTPSMPKDTMQQRRRSSLAVGSTSESEEDSSAEEDSDDETGNRSSQFDRLSRPGKGRAKSEAGHGSGSTFKRNDIPPPQRAPQSHLGHSMIPSRSQVQSSAKQEETPPRSQSSLSRYGGSRKRASLSASALTPSAAAQRASTLAASNSNVGPDRGLFKNSPPPRQSQAPPPVQRSSKATSDSDSEDDAPLATLVAPRRPGSAMSSYSSLHSRSTGNVTTRSTHPKPLIDINELTGRKPSLPIKSTAGFTGGQTLLGQATYSSSPLVESPTSAYHEPLTRTAPPVKFVSPPGSPSPEPKQFSLLNDSQIPSRPRTESHLQPAPVRRDTSPEQHRDLLTDRLSRAVKLTLSPPTPSSPALQSPSSSQSSAPASRGVSPFSADMSDRSRKQRSDALPRVETRRPSFSPNPPVKPTERDDHSSPDEELAQLLGSALKLISRNGETPDSSSESESDDDDDDDEKDMGSDKATIAPIPIKQRSPPPAFSVTSRPSFPRKENATAEKKKTLPPETKPSPSYTTSRPRSTTMTTTTSSPSVSSSKPFALDSSSRTSSPTPVASKSASKISNATNGDASQSERSTALRPGPAMRQRSSTMLTGVPLSSQMPRSSSHIPEKPFAVRRNSPASSTGDSSSGRAPFTPRDGSDDGAHEKSKEKKREWSGGASGLGNTRHVKRRSVSFEDELPDLKPPSRSHFREGARGSTDGGDSSAEEDREERRRERRRGEAKAAIELGNIVNGPGPIVSDDDDDLPINQTISARVSAVNPMMAMSNSMPMPMGFGSSPSVGWGANMSQQMLSPAQFMTPPPADPNFLAAHQQAMMIAKQAYQMAVAQHAMAAAGDEWERGSTIGGFGGGSVYGGPSGPSMMTPQFGMMNMMQGGGGGVGWSGSASVYGGPTRSMYGGSAMSPGVGMMSSSRSEYGGGRGGAANWSSSRSSYGESFGPPSDAYGRKAPTSGRPRPNGRDSGLFPPVPPIPASQYQNGRSNPDGRSASRSRTTSQPTPSPPRGVGVARKAPPPSSWRAGM